MVDGVSMIASPLLFSCARPPQAPFALLLNWLNNLFFNLLFLQLLLEVIY